MMNMALYKREMKGSIKLLVIFGAVITLYVSIIISMYDPEMMKSLDSFVEVMPELMAAVGMKENARELRNTIASLGDLNEDEMLNKKAAYSSNENIASATFIGAASDSASASSVEIEVRSLATSQVNMGNYLPGSETVNLAPATYSFDVGIDDLNYEFQFTIKPEDTNRDVQDRLSRLINNANIGISAQVVTNEIGRAHV